SRPQPRRDPPRVPPICVLGLQILAPFSQLKEYQQKNSPGATAAAKKKRKSKDGSRPETPTNDDRKSPENVSSFWVC
uniref:Uncharacterized protein n=1 Tax=Chrysemys picta bellii TaxID=8478 RepID=A0A8C3IMC0_CHRPI